MHPSAIAPGADGLARAQPQARRRARPTPRDKHCLAPELQRTLEPGDAVLERLLAGRDPLRDGDGAAHRPGHEAPARHRARRCPRHSRSSSARPSSAIAPTARRDLGALASAMYHVAPQKSIHPPDISEARLDASAELDVDVKFSMLPPCRTRAGARDERRHGRAEARRGCPASTAGDPFGAPVIDRTAVPARLGKRRRRSDRAASRPSRRASRAIRAPATSSARTRWTTARSPPWSCCSRSPRTRSPASTGCATRSAASSMPIAEWEEFAPFAEQTQPAAREAGRGEGRRPRGRRRQEARRRQVDRRRQRRRRAGGRARRLVLHAARARTTTTSWSRGDPHRHRRGQRRHQGQEGQGPAAAAGAAAGAAAATRAGTSFENVLNSNNETITMGQAPGRARPDERAARRRRCATRRSSAAAARPTT